MTEPSPETIDAFISRWEKSGGSEKANYALFFTELCDEILHVPHPEPAGPENAQNLYVFERAVTHKEADGWSDLRSRDIPVANKEAAHSCAAGESAADAPRAALSSSASLSPSRQECRDSLSPPAGREGFEEALLTRLVALNHEHAAEEKRGHIRYLRPDYQNPTAANSPAEQQPSLAGTEASSPQSPISNPQSPLQWPTGLAAQVSAIQKLIPHLGPDPEALSAQFGKKNAKRTQQVVEILETLAGLGKL